MGYRLPLAYFMTQLVVYVYSFIAILRKMAENSRMSKLSEKEDECVFTWKVFTGWDYMIGNSETAHNRVSSIVMGFKEALLEEAEKKRDSRNWKIITTRVVVNLMVMSLLILSAGVVVKVVQRSTEAESMSTVWRRNEITVVLNLISTTFPMGFELLGIIEKYHPRKALRIHLARIMFLNLLNVYTLIFAQFDKIDGMTKRLNEIKSMFKLPTEIMNDNCICDDKIGTAFVTPHMIENITTTAVPLLLTSSDTFDFKDIDYNNNTITSEFNFENTTSNEFPNVSTNIFGAILNQNTTDVTNFTSLVNQTFDFYNSTYTFNEKNMSTGVDGFEDYVNIISENFEDPLIKQLSLINFTVLDTNSTENKMISNGSFQDNGTLYGSELFRFNATDDILDFNEDFDETVQNFTKFNSTVEEGELLPESVTTDIPDFSEYYKIISHLSRSITKTWNESSDNNFNTSTTLTPNCEIICKNKTPSKTSYPNDTIKLLDWMEGKASKLPYQNRSELRTLCWETMFGQELVKLIIMDLIMTALGILAIDFFRGLFLRVMNRCWCWDLEKNFPEYGEFKVAENILHLVNNQGMVWMGMFFSPGLVWINVIKLYILMYLRSWTVLTCNVPHSVVFRASRSNNFYYTLLLMMLFLCTLPVGYAVVWVEPSWHCGPFSDQKRIFRIFTKTLRRIVPEYLHKVLDYIASPGIIIPLLILLILIIYYLISLTSALREANNDLKIQLRQERTEERRKMFKLVDRRRRVGSTGSGEFDSTPFSRWKKLLNNLPSQKSLEEVVREPDIEILNPDRKDSNRTKEILTKFLRKALGRASTSEEENPQVQDDATDNEQHESLPDDNVLREELDRKKSDMICSNFQSNVHAALSRKKTEPESKPNIQRKNLKDIWSPDGIKTIRTKPVVDQPIKWTENIPLITISKTESDESLLRSSKTDVKIKSEKRTEIVTTQIATFDVEMPCASENGQNSSRYKRKLQQKRKKGLWKQSTQENIDDIADENIDKCKSTLSI